MAADGATTGPESPGVGPALLMHVMVKQVLVLGEKIWGRRRRVVGAKAGCQTGIAAEKSGDLPDRIGAHGNVAVDKEEDLAPGNPGTPVAGPSGPAGRGNSQEISATGRAAAAGGNPG